MAQALLKAGAHLEDVDGGRTALWYAACAGNWRVTTVLLRARSKSAGRLRPMSAAECTRRARPGRSESSSNSPRPRATNY